MQIEQITLTAFKNYAYQELRFSTKLNCFVGLNGMGKTNLLDAIYYLCFGRSYFSHNDRLVARRTERTSDFFRLEGQFSRLDKPEHLVAKIVPGKRKEIERNKVAYTRLSEHLGLFPVVMIAPFDIRIVLEGSEIRRKFIDNTLSQINLQYLQSLIQYNKTLQQRNALLKRFAEQRSFDPTLIDVYDAQLVPLGQYIFEQRSQFLKDFQSIFTELYAAISAEQEVVHYKYSSSLERQDFRTLLRDSLEKDRILQRTTQGIHKDDLVFTINDFALKRYASQGQLKSFVLALKLAQYQVLKTIKNFQPILLLDDIFDKLDGNRVTQLIHLLLQQDFGQIFITDTDEYRIEHIIQAFNTDYRKFKIKNGEVDDTM